jgi:DNA-binding CsgD family transcriptional regulator
LADESVIARSASPDFLEAVTTAAAGHFTPFAAGAAADLFRSRGETEKARALLHDCIGMRWDGSGDDMCALSLRIGDYGAEEDLERAREVFAPFLETKPTRYLRAQVALFDAFVARREGDRSALERHASAAEALFFELQRPYERAQALELLDQKAEAAAIYRETGDMRALRRLEKQLLPINRRGRPKTELTNREREIATLVAQGKSNLAIADELFIGERTVETHVSSIFAKLGVTSRTELAAIILRTAAP